MTQADATSNTETLPAGWPEPVEARVVRVCGPRAVEVELGGAPFPATLATTGDYVPALGDRVVVLAGRHGSWIVGVVGALRAAVPTSDGRTSDGRTSDGRTSDGVEANVEHDVLTVRDPRGEVLFTHDARSGTSTVRSREVRIEADELDLAARSVRIEGTDEVRISRGDDHLVMNAKETELLTKRFRGEMQHAQVSISDAVLGIGRLQSAVTRAKHVVEVLDIDAGRIVERAKDVFRETEGVSQTRAGRIRMVAEGVFSVLSERLTMKAEDDMALMGEKIELG